MALVISNLYAICVVLLLNGSILHVRRQREGRRRLHESRHGTKVLRIRELKEIAGGLLENLFTNRLFLSFLLQNTYSMEHKRRPWQLVRRARRLVRDKLRGMSCREQRGLLGHKISR